MNTIANDIRFIRLPEVQRITGLGRSQIYTLAQRDAFPKPVKLAERCSAWIESEVTDWVRARIAAARQQRVA